MQARVLIVSTVLAACCAAQLAADDRRDPRDDGRRHGGPNILIEPNIDLTRPRVDVDAPEFIMDEVGRCAAAGVRSFVDCLRPNHSSVMIRRLEACVRSETIPDDPQRVAACLPPAPVR